MEIKIFALKHKKSAEDQINKLVFKGNSRFLTQLVTQIRNVKDYESIVSIALNLEQVISIADAVLSYRHFIPHGLLGSSDGTWGASFTALALTSESKRRVATPNHSPGPQSPSSTIHILDSVPYDIFRCKYIKMEVSMKHSSRIFIIIYMKL